LCSEYCSSPTGSSSAAAAYLDAERSAWRYREVIFHEYTTGATATAGATASTTDYEVIKFGNSSRHRKLIVTCDCFEFGYTVN
jgi:hypothetical protein